MKDEEEEWHVIVTAEDGLQRDDYNRFDFFSI